MPELQNMVPMYPKHLVYRDGTEYSLEELRAKKYLLKKQNTNEERMSEDMCYQQNEMVSETEQAVQSIINGDNNVSKQSSQKNSHQNMQNFPKQNFYPQTSVNQDESKFLGLLYLLYN